MNILSPRYPETSMSQEPLGTFFEAFSIKFMMLLNARTTNSLKFFHKMLYGMDKYPRTRIIFNKAFDQDPVTYWLTEYLELSTFFKDSACYGIQEGVSFDFYTSRFFLVLTLEYI